MTVALSAMYAWQRNSLAAQLPQDRELLTMFYSHRREFEKLRTMATADTGNASYISTDSLKASTLNKGRSNLNEARRDEYLRLLLEIRPDLVIRISFYKITFSYSAGGVGLAIGHSWMKGIAYLPHGHDKAGTIVNSLDTLPTDPGAYLVPIDGSWYIIYSQLD